MKPISTILLLMLTALCTSAQNHVCGNSDELASSRSTPSCSSVCADYGLEYYIPTEQSPTLNVKVYFHVFQNGSLNFQESDPQHTAYLEGILPNINSIILGNEGVLQKCGDSDPELEGCQPNNPGDPTIDSKIRLQLGGIIWYDGVDGIDGALNGGSGCGSYTYDTYIAPNPEFNDGLNILFLDIPGITIGGCGPGPYATVFNAIDRYVPGQPWKERSNIMHEIGHVLGLPHVWTSCAKNTLGYSECPSVTNNFLSCYNQLMGYNGEQVYLNHLEVANMRRTLLNSGEAKPWVTNYPQQKETITINSPEVWSTQVRWYGDIIIEAGGELTIEGTLRLGEGSKIIVKRGAKLIVDNGTITTCGGIWQGIIVEGARDQLGQLSDPFANTNVNYAGTVILINGARLEYAKNGISCNVKHISWPAVKNYWGGLVYTNNASFGFCNRAVEFMKNDGDDKSQFINTDFQDGENGVTIWASDGIEFTQCNFNRIDYACIGIFDAELVIFGNRFNNSHIGIDIGGSGMKNIETRIGVLSQEQNIFLNVDVGIYNTGVHNIAPLAIQNNSFTRNIEAIINDGLSHFSIQNNDFYETTFAVVTKASGSDFQNFIKNNLHTNNTFGNLVSEENPGLSILDNCFDSDRNLSHYNPFDIYLENGSLKPDQGFSFGSAAGNCFTPPSPSFGPRDIATVNASPFAYHIAGDGVEGCDEGNNPNGSLVPQNPGNYIVAFDAGFTSSSACGISGFEAPPTSESACDHEGSISIISNRIVELETQIIELKGNEELSFEQVVQLSQLKNCLQLNLTALYTKYDETGNLEEASGFFIDRNSFQARIPGFDLLVKNEAYSQARNYLNNMASFSLEEEHYVLAQNLLLDYLENGPEFVYEANQMNDLYTAGQTKHTYKGPIRSIYQFLTGEKIPVELPEARAESRTAEDIIAEKQILIFPNPVTKDIFRVQCPLELCNHLEIQDLSGKALKTIKVTEEITEISTNDLSQGIYIVVAKKEAKLWKSDKLVIIR